MNKDLVLVKVLGTRCLYAYPSCLICLKKVRKLHDQDGRLWCSTCLRFYTEKNVHYRYHVNLTVSDCSGIASVTVFGKSLETFFGLKATEFCRYVMKCGRKNSLQGFDIDKVVHLAMENCFTGKMVYLVFRPTNYTTCKSNFQGLQVNVLPASKATNFTGNCKIPELLANAICKVESEKQHRSIADVLTEYLGFEKSSLSNGWGITDNCTADDFSHPVANKENEIFMLDESHRNQDDVVSPRNLLCVSSDVNKLVLSMMSSDSDCSNDLSFVGNLSSHFENVQPLTCFEPGQVIDVAESGKSSIIRDEILTLRLSHLHQSFCCSSNTNNPCGSSIREENPNNGSCHDNPTSKGALFSESVSEKGRMKPARLFTNTANVCFRSGDQLDMPKYDDSSCYSVHRKATDASKGFSEQDQYRAEGLGIARNLTYSPNVNSANNNAYDFDMFDSPTSEDLDAFLAQISLSWPTTKPDQIDATLSQSCCKDDKHCPADAGEPNFTSDSKIVSLENDHKTCLTSTPSLANHSYHKTSDLDGIINSTYSPIYSECINDIRKNIPVDYNDTPDMFGSGGKLQAKPGLPSTPISQFECTSNCLYSSISRKSKCKKSSGKVSSKDKLKSKNLWKCILSTKKSTLCSSQLKNAAESSPEKKRPPPVLLSQKASPVSSPLHMLRVGQAMPNMCPENSLLLFEDESDMNGSKEEGTKPKRNFEELSSNSIPVCSELNAISTNPTCSHTIGDRTCLSAIRNNSFDEKFNSTCGSPLLFSQ